MPLPLKQYINIQGNSNELLKKFPISIFLEVHFVTLQKCLQEIFSVFCQVAFLKKSNPKIFNDECVSLNRMFIQENDEL